MSDGDRRTMLGVGHAASATPGAATPAPAAAVGGVDPLIGTTLGERYFIEQKLGEGGMGSVYRARHTALDKPVALKLLHAEFAHKQDLVERFLQEARAASRIRHENIIDITDFGITPEGWVFFAMELLSGTDLHDELARARLSSTVLPWSRTKPIFLQICAALAAAHSHGVIHRDLKPENIFLVEWLGHKDFVKLLDFGIAKMTEVSPDGRKLTRTGMLFGTPEYMSPEQARGEKPDHRVDIYAMGCILYQLVTGRVPFEADNFMGILNLHLTATVPPLGDALVKANAPHELEAVVARALHKDRAQRYQTVGELADAVRRAAGDSTASVVKPLPKKSQWGGTVRVPDEPESADLPAVESRGSKRRTIALGGAAVIAVAAAIIAYSMLGNGAEPAQPEQPEQPAPPAQPASAATATPTGAPVRVRLRIDSVPPGAQVVDVATGQSGAAPFTILAEQGSAERQFQVTLDGYKPATKSLVPDTDHSFTVPLEEIAPAPTPPDPVAAGEARKPPRRPSRPDTKSVDKEKAKDEETKAGGGDVRIGDPSLKSFDEAAEDAKKSETKAPETN